VTVRLAGVFAHPDDDSWLIAGSLLLHPGEVDLTLVFATSGEAGPIADPSLATRDTLGGVREREQRAFLEAIGYTGARVEFLRHPDYFLPDVPFEQLVGEIQRLLEEVRPHVVVTFGPDGMTSHHDHIRAGAAATRAFDRARRTSRPGELARLYHGVLARSDVDRFCAAVRDGGHDYGDEGRLFDVTGVPDERIAVRVDTRLIRDRKLMGIRAHRTQRDEFERVPEPLRWLVLDVECFVQARPVVERPDRVRSDLFEDLTDVSLGPATDPRGA
jgi:LmbE family N-acetylglucosaminyl deacetylase